MNLKKVFIALTAIAAIQSANANSVSLVDTNFSLFNGATQVTTGLLDARWGTFSGGIFTPFLGAVANSDNSGYIDVSSPELFVSLGQGDNVTVVAGVQLALALTVADFGTTYQSGTEQIILTDSTWLVPTFALVGQPDLAVAFTANTAVLGNSGLYTFGGGNEVINFVAVPEPSTYAAIAGLAVLGVVASRRRRSA